MAKKKKPIDLAAVRADDPLLITFAEAQTKYGLSDFDLKRLKGKVHTDSLHDPIGSLEHGVVRDDRRLERFCKSVKSL